MEVRIKNEGSISTNNTNVSVRADITDDEKVKAYIAELERENHDLQQKWLDESFEKSKLVTENKRLNLIILGNEEEISELKKQVRGYLINYSDNNLVKLLKDCIIQNKKLSSQEQNQLSAWVECAMDFGTNLDECSNELDKAKEIIRNLIRPLTEEEKHLTIDARHKWLEKAKQILKEE